MPTFKPKIGLIVHFSTGVGAPCRPAIIVSVAKGQADTLNVNVAQDVWDSSFPWVRVESVRYNEFGGSNTWHSGDECSLEPQDA